MPTVQPEMFPETIVELAPDELPEYSLRCAVTIEVYDTGAGILRYSFSRAGAGSHIYEYMQPGSTPLLWADSIHRIVQDLLNAAIEPF